MLPKGKLLSDAEWRAYGVQQSRGWEHYAIHKPEQHILLFRRALGTDPTTGRVSGAGVRVEGAAGRVSARVGAADTRKRRPDARCRCPCSTIAWRHRPPCCCRCRSTTR